MTKEQEELNKAIEEAANDTPTTISMKSFKEGALTALTTESIYSKAGLGKDKWVLGKPSFDREMMFVSAREVNGEYVYRMWKIEWVRIDGERRLIFCDESGEFCDFEELHIDMYKEILPAHPNNKSL